MKLRSLLLLCAFALPVFSFAQPDNPRKDHFAVVNMGQTVFSSLSIYSVNGEQFFLVLNGLTQNNVPTSRIRVEGLPQYANDVEIIFADKSQPAIRKRIMVADPVSVGPVDMTLKIFTSLEQYPELRFHKSTEVEHDYHPQRDECVMHYGKPGQNNTTTVYEQNTSPPPVPMDPRTFEDAKHSIGSASFEDARLSTAKTILNSNYVTTNQVIEMCKLFSFDNNKLTFAQYAYGRTVDPNNYFKVANVFSFDSDKEKLNNFISGNHR